MKYIPERDIDLRVGADVFMTQKHFKQFSKTVA